MGDFDGDQKYFKLTNDCGGHSRGTQQQRYPAAGVPSSRGTQQQRYPAQGYPQQRYPATGVPSSRGTQQQRYPVVGVPSSRGTQQQRYPAAEVPSSRGTQQQGYPAAGVPSSRVPSSRGTQQQGYPAAGVPSSSAKVHFQDSVNPTYQQQGYPAEVPSSRGTSSRGTSSRGTQQQGYPAAEVPSNRGTSSRGTQQQRYPVVGVPSSRGTQQQGTQQQGYPAAEVPSSRGTQQQRYPATGVPVVGVPSSRESVIKSTSLIHYGTLEVLWGKTHELVSEQQESRPLLSPSIDDFLPESRNDATSIQTPTSNTAVLSTPLDLVDLSNSGDSSGRTNKDHWRSPLKRNTSSESPRCQTRTEETELIQVEVEQLPTSPRTPERISLDSVGPSTPLDKWHNWNLDVEDGGHRRRYKKRCSSHHSSSELLWSAEFKTDPLTKTHLDIQSFDDLDFAASVQDGGDSRQCRPTRSLLIRNESLEDEFVRAKAAVESDTEFWDKMQAEWEELARRNWLEESEGQLPVPPTVLAVEKGYYFITNNPYRDYPNVFMEGQERARDGDLNTALLLLEAAILQDPQDAEAWQLLGMTQAENENEQAAIVSLERCLELRPNNLLALMALAVSFTNISMQREACDALHRWISHNPRYRHLVQKRSPLRGSPATLCRGPRCSSTMARCELEEVLLLFQKAALLNLDCVDPDLQTGLGVLFNLSADFEKAVEAFSAALSVRPQDYLLWNRLGATLANGNRSKEAVEAYTRALELQPGFIRSRYNLGISCINLGAHREAVSNFLTALNQQRRSQRRSHQEMSANIWAALRIAISMMDRPELFQAANVGDLDLLMRAFEVGDA
ncbi:PEX5-related protein-like [Xenentodon cancila]